MNISDQFSQEIVSFDHFLFTDAVITEGRGSGFWILSCQQLEMSMTWVPCGGCSVTGHLQFVEKSPYGWQSLFCWSCNECGWHSPWTRTSSVTGKQASPLLTNSRHKNDVATQSCIMNKELCQVTKQVSINDIRHYWYEKTNPPTAK